MHLDLDNSLPLSPYQELFFYEWELDTLGYNIFFLQEILGSLDIERLSLAWKRIVMDFLYYHLYVSKEQGKISLVSFDNQSSSIEYIDHALSFDEIKSLIRKPFDLTNKSSLTRLCVIKKGIDKYCILFVCHHLISGGMNIYEFVRLLSNYYNDIHFRYSISIKTQQQENLLFVRKVKGMLEAHREILMNFWREKLEGGESISLDFLKLPQGAYKYNKENKIFRYYSVPLEYVMGVARLAKQRVVTDYIIYITTLSVLFYKHLYEAPSKLLFSLPYLLNSKAYIQGVNNIFIPFCITRTKSFLCLLEDTKGFFKEIKKTLVIGEEVIPAYTPTYWMIDTGDIHRLDRPVALVQQGDVSKALFSFDGTSKGEWQYDTVESTMFSDRLIINIQRVGEQGIRFFVECKETGINEQLMDVFFERYFKLLGDVLLDVTKTIGEYNILTDKEYQYLLYDYNKTEKEYPKDKTIHQLFEEQVARTPNNIAVVFEDKKLTYKELSNKANQLANYLHNNYQTKADDIICLLLERSEWIIIAILGVLKSGAAYCPISPEYPEERILFILQDTQPKCLITNCTLKIENVQFLIINLMDEQCLKELYSLTINHLPLTISSRSLAYIIYTSGTTGNPKGVMVEHKNVVNLLYATAYILYPINQIYLRASAFTSYQFDVSVSEFLSPLVQGGELHIFNELAIQNISFLSQYIIEKSINYLYIPPVLLSQLPQHIYPELKHIIYAGEPCNRNIANDWSKNYLLFNYYGPTEATIYALGKQINIYEVEQIGKPIYNIKIYLLNNNLQLLPIGSMGELYIGGDGVARGYLNRPELTAERFIQNPFQIKEEKQKNRNSKLYKTGDIVRMLPDGNIEYIGRNDFQVKIRGYRIELGEIENRILGWNNGEVIQQVVVLLNEKGDNKYLVGYFVAKEKVDVEELRSYLSKQLPEYMVPTGLVQIEQMPLTVNGKLDRKALLNIEYKISDEVIELPKNNTEERLLKIWSNLLKISESELSVTQSFFRLGGNSLLSIRLVGQLNRELLVQLSVKDIFAYPTIREISHIIEQKDTGFVYQDYMLTDIKKEDYSLFPLNNVQQAYYMGRIDLFEIGNISTGGYSEFVVNDLSVENLEKALNRLVLRHAGLRTVFTDQGQQILPADNCHYSIPVNKITTEEALLDIRNRLLNMKVDVSRFPIIVIEVSEYKGSYVIHFMSDAIIMDNNSMRIFCIELAKIYNNLDIVLPTLHITYHEYILALQRIRDSKLFDKAKTYWETKLEDYDFSCNLPIVIEPSMVKQSTTKRGLRIIEKETYDMLQEKLAKIQLSPTSLLLSLYGKVLCRWSGQDKFSINLTLFNRLPLHKEVNDILGDFTNLELYNYDDAKSRDIVEYYLKGVQNVLWDDIENNLFDGIDFQRLIRERKQWSISKAIAPIVLTSVLGFKEKKEEGDVVNLFGRQHYSISRTSQVWIDNAVYEDDNGNLILRWDFVEQLFLPEVIEGMLDEYAYLIRKIAAMDIKRDRLEFYRLPATYQHIIEKYNATAEEYDVKTIIDFYDNCVIQDAYKCNAIAVVEGGNNKQAYKHREVAIGSKNIATHLYKYYKEEQTVAILSEKGYNQVVSSLGIMQSGQAYIPLNIHWSASRILEIMEESGTKVLLISKKEYENKRQLQASNIRLLIIEELLLKEQEGDIHLPIVLLSDIAYIIYTSGSTGKPKGVAISHENMMNTLIAVNNRYKVTEKDSVLALSELSFDLSVYDIFGLLLVGGRIVFVNDEERQDPQHWLSLIEKHKITLWNTVPQLAELLVDEARTREMRLDSIRLYLLSGDWLPLQLPDKIKRQSKDTQVISLGGATEGSIWSIWYEIGIVEGHWKSIPYGYPMPNQQIYILNHELIHSPIGVEGDIYIGGKGVAQGYWNNEEETKKQFVVHHELGRIYKTGDRGILHAEGWVEFRGRKDFQVKIRGYRVELEEIENKLNKLEGVKQSAVQLFKKNNSEVLVGFVVREQLITKGVDETFDKEVFKLEQRGIRKDLTDTIIFKDNDIAEQEYRLTKSYRNFGDRVVDTSLIDTIIREAKQIKVKTKNVGDSLLTKDKIARVLTRLQGKSLSDKILPKYLYPSGGSAYPIECYVRVSESGIKGIEEGVYYYHPLNNALQRVEDHSNNDQDSIELIVNWSAIKPLYGDFADKLVWIELGHILELLSTELNRLGIAFDIQIKQENRDESKMVLAEIVLGVDGNQIEQLTSELTAYYVSKRGNIYEGLIDLDKYSVFDRAIEQAKILENGKGMIVVECDSRRDKACLVSQWIGSGIMIERIKQQLLQYNIGGCPLGSEFGENELYSMVIGYIINEEKTKGESKVAVDKLSKVINDSLGLPDYMSLQEIVFLDSMPLTESGKLDKSRLPDPEIEWQSYIAPNTQEEQEMVEIWSEILNIGKNKIGIEDSFFNLGGHSITAIRLISKINSRFNFGLSFKDLFEYPTIRGLIKNSITLKQREQEGDYMPYQLIDSSVAISKEDYEDCYPAGMLQLGMFFEQEKLGHGAYLTFQIQYFSGTCNREKIERCLQTIINRHDILRTGYRMLEDGNIYALVQKRVEVKGKLFFVTDSIEEVRKKEIVLAFNREIAGLYRFYIIEQAEGFVLFFSFHHAILDGYSLNLFIRELVDLYQHDNDKLYEEEQSKLLYGEFIRNELSALNNEDTRLFWREYLAESILLTPQWNFSKSNGVSVVAERQQIEGLRLRQIEAISSKYSCTVEELLLLSYMTVLSLFFNERDITIGLEKHNRIEKEGGDRQLGLFVTMLPFRYELRDKEALGTALSRLRDSVKKIVNHKQYPYNEIKQQLGGRDLFDIAYSYNDFSHFVGHEERTHINEFLNEELSNITSILFICKVYKYSGGYGFVFSGHSNSVDQAYLSYFVRYYNSVLDQLCKEERVVFKLMDEDYQYLVYDYNKTEKEYPKDKTIHQLFEEQVTRTPNNIAVIFEEKQLTYQELNSKANQLAYYLYHNYNTKADDIICLLLERSEWMIIAILGVLKSGAAYCPISPEYPEERVLFILQDTKPKCLIINCKLQIEHVQFPIVNVTDEQFLKELYSLTINHLPLTISSHALAYVIYTSGTTGNPKGVMIEHGGVVNRIVWMQSKYPLNEEDRVLQKTNCSFDVSVWELLWANWAVATIVVLKQGLEKDATQLLSTIQERKITTIHFVPSVLVAFLEHIVDKENCLASLKYLFCSGEALELRIVIKFKYLFPAVSIHNLYGPTEASIDVLFADCNNLDKETLVPIGKPIDNTVIYILDSDKRLLPMGAIGELYIGGDGLARGYLNRLELTAEKFIQNPFQAEEEKKQNRNERIYKTGDLVRMLPDGNIEYIGRNDFQVKIRGYRIELGEIENRILEWKDGEVIQQAVVLVNEKADNKYLVGYFVAREQVDVEELRSDLSKQLPEYMVPTGLVQIEQMPLTVNGKLDRKTLLSYDCKLREEEIELPKNNTEKRLLKIWSGLLQISISDLSVTQSFFRLGGNSILSIRLMNLINKEFNTSFSVRIIFEINTIRQLAKYLLSDNIEKISVARQVFNSEEEQVLSYAQNRLWFIYQYDKANSAVYNIPMVFEIDKMADKEKLKEALLFVVGKHEVLRTVVEENERGATYQSIKEIPENLIQEEVYISKSDVEKKILTAVRYSFQLDKELPIQIKFFTPKKKDGKIILTIVVHHIAFDGWSVEVFQKEVYYAYQLLVNQKQLTHTTNIQYKDYALWQRDFLQGERWDKELNYWKEQLDGYNNSHLPVDFSRPLQMNYEGDAIISLLSKETSQNLKVVAKQLNASLYSVLLSGYYLFLSAYSNEQDIVVGTPFANRHYAGTEDMIGFFVNSLALRIQIDFKDTLKAYIEKVNVIVTQGQNNQDIPFEQLVEELHVERDTSRHPIFQIMFGVQDFGGGDTTLFKTYQNNRTNIIPAKFDVTTMVSERNDGLQICFNYATALYKRETIDRFVKTYELILTQIVRDRLDNDLKSIRFVNNEEYNYLIYEYNKTEREYPKDKTIHQLFEEQVERTPNNIAVVFEEKQLTYQELNNKANQLAYYLYHNYNTKADDIICLLLERSEWMIIAILGVLKSGAAYCPISPEYPEERVLFILQDTKPKCLIINCKLQIEHVQFPIVNVTDEQFLKELYSLTINHLPLTISSHALAYVIYTSGTTGNPKGVMIEHGGVVNRIVWMQSKYPLNEEDRVLQKTNCSFDVSVWELLWANWAGATIVVLKQGLEKDATQLLSTIQERKITTIHFVPSVLVAFLEYIVDKENCLASLKYLFCSGEALELRTVIKFKYLFPAVSIHNLYGPTEASIDVLFADCNNLDKETLVPIGKPIDNTVIYILDSDKRLLPMGAIGELYIGGDGLARGYLNRLELTAEKFIQNPFQAEEEKKQNRNERIYKTGDLVRMLPDGNIEYIGRNDFQVKIRGYRIELGEIENRILEWKDGEVIQQAVVLVNEKADNKYLVGYFVAREQVDVEELRSDLSKQLPEYMVPTGLVQIEQMPLTVNGKLDRKTLLSYDCKLREEEIELPKNNTEKRLLKIWSGLLQISISDLSVTQSFFRLGGNSILSIRLMNLINKEFNTSFSVRIIFEINTIRQLAKYLLSDNIEKISVARQVFNSEEEQVLSYAQNRLWFIYQYDKANSAVYNIPMVFEIDKMADKEKLKEALLFVVGKHEVLRTVVEENERGATYQSIKEIPENLIQEEVYISKSDVEKKILTAVRYSFQLDKELPIQIKFFTPKKKDGKIILTIVVHHIAFDGWSVEVFQKEVYYAYQLLVNQKQLTHTTNIQYKDYALWQRDFLQGERWDKELNYWKEQLDGYNNSHLPVDFSRPLQMNYEGDAIISLLSKETSQNLKVVAKQLNASLYSVLLSGYYLFLSAYSNEQDIVVGTPFANRHYAGTEDMIGFFVNSLALRIQIDFKDTLKAYIEKVNVIVTQGQNNQDIPFEQLVEELHVERDTSRHPIFQIMFGVQDFGGGDTTLFKTYQNNRTNIIPAKFDVTTMVSERNDGLQICFNYATALYKRETIDRFVKTYELILTQIVRDRLDNDLKSIRFVNNEEYNYLIYEYNKTEREYPKDKTIHQLFEEQVERTPNNIAVVFEEKQLTYQELNNKANQLANYLHNNYHTQADDIICLLLERSEWMIIAILGVLKSGAAYCPISPEYPEERILFILQDTQPKCLITNCKLKIEHVQFAIVNVTDEQFLKGLYSLTINHLPLTIHSHALAYIIYTSGTTGNPKGVMVEHRNVVNYLFWMKVNDYFLGVNNIDASIEYFFDALAQVLFTPLVEGKKVVIASQDRKRDIVIYVNYLIDNKIELIKVTPSYLEWLVDELLNDEWKERICLRKIIVGGESANLILRNRLLSLPYEIIHHYGPTEATIGCLSMLIDKNKLPDFFSLGKFTHNINGYILNNNLQLLPIGSMGELYIGGDGVARGYLNRHELTAEKFIKNPFQTEEDKKKNRNSRLYKTGDVVRMLPDGNIEYIVRNDFQVKIRGYRIELGEIENRIQGFQTRIEGLKDKQVIEQVVVLVNEKGDNKYLVGYFVAKEQVNVDELRSYLSKQLPEYMAPTGLVQIEQMPLTVNGKLDRKALLNIEYKITDEVIEVPKNNTEERLLKIWSNLLKISESELSVTQSFFRLGGNSILSIRLMNLINKEFNTSFSVRIIFERNTIRQLVEYLLEDNIEIIAVQKQSFNSEEEQVLSYAQNRLWFIYQYDKANSAVYNIPMVFELNKEVDKEKLKESLLFVVEKHEILRTIIEENENGITYQSVKTISDNLIQEEIYSSKSDVEEKILSVISYSFQLDKELPIQIRFFIPKKKYDTIVLTIVVHHIVFDGWSVEVFQKEVYHAYQLLVNQKQLTHTTNIQYKDYALWQRKFLQGGRYEKELNYWKGQLDGYNNSHLPIDFSRPLEINYEGDAIIALLSKETSQNVKTVAKELNASLYSVLLSGYYLFLSAYSNEQDIVVGSPFANRHYAGTEEMIGFFVNSLALRVHIDFKDTLKEYIKKVNTIVVQGQNNQDIPFEQLVEELRVERDTSRHPIFQIMFGVQNFGGDDTTFFKFYQSDRINTIPAKFDITTMVSEVKDGLQIYFNYAIALYKRETIERFVKTYELVLTQIAKNKLDNSVNSIRFIDDREYNYLVYDYNKTEKDYPKDKTIHQLFEEQVTRTPNNIAVIFEEKQLTYQELNSKANQLAHYLHNNYNTKADDIICLLLKRSEWMIISILGVLKSGAAYCPISPEYPEERILFILHDTQPKCLITNCKLKIENIELPIVNLTDEQFLKELYSLTINHLPLIIHSHALAYVIYTSGTTGNPKGVMVTHQSVSNLVHHHKNIFDDLFSTTIHLLGYSNYIFDASVWEYYTALLLGYSLYLISDDIRKSNDLLLSFIRQNNIEIALLPPIIVEQLDIINLRILFVGGDRITNLITCKHRTGLLINAFGPTEYCVMGSTHIYIDEFDISLHIGKPITNTKYYVLNPTHKPLPMGAIGELYIGGDGLARGYLNRLELTAEKFIQNPFQAEEEKKQNRNERIYKTGDLVRMLPDGNIEYIGRNDFQVKIRGYRIELGEIENRILEWKDGEVIQQAVVLVNEKADNKYLVGYFVAREQVDVEELRSDISKQLPEYMVPTGLVQIEQMPLTVNGKLYRKILLNMEVNFVGENIQAPANKLELRILQIFVTLLSLESNTISVTNSFFRLGGNSILSIRLASILNREFGTFLSVADIFKYPTIRELAVQANYKKTSFDLILMLNNSVAKQAIYMIHPGGAGAEVYYNMAYRLQESYRCYGIGNYNLFSDNKMSEICLLAKHYLHEIKKNITIEPCVLLGWSLGGKIALEMAYHLEQQGIKDIVVYLLDTTVMDETLINILNKKNLSFRKQALNELLDNLNVGEDYKQRVLANRFIEEKLNNDALTGKLIYSRCVLFKAMLSDKDEIADFFQYKLSLPYNNVDKYVPIENIEVIEMQVSHQDIIKKEDEIVDVIKQRTLLKDANKEL